MITSWATGTPVSELSSQITNLIKIISDYHDIDNGYYFCDNAKISDTNV